MSATARRGGLALRLQLPQDTYLAGEGGRAEIALRNDGAEPVALAGSTRFGWGGVLLLDGRGRRPVSWPWGSSGRGGPPRVTTVAPGQEARATGRFQIPPMKWAAGHTYTLQAPVSSVHPASRDGRTNWSRLTATLSLRVTPPAPAQHLQARLEADPTGWRLQVADGTGRTPPGPLWGEVEIEAYRLSSGGPLPDSSDGRWSESWGDYALAAQSPITIRVWVAAPGFVIAGATRTVPAPPSRRASVPPKATGAAIARVCGPWPPSSTAPRDNAQIECAARLAAGRRATERRGGFAMRRMPWREAAADLGVDPASGPDAGQAVWVVELDSASAVGTVVVLDGETGEPLLVLERQPAP